jgi:hypothetical protein
MEQKSHFSDGHVVAQYYPKSNNTNFSNIPPSSSFQTPRLVSQSYSTSASARPPRSSPQIRVEQRSQTAPDERHKIPEIRTVVAVPETDILDDNYSDNEDEIIGADEHRDGSIDCKFFGS